MPSPASNEKEVGANAEFVELEGVLEEVQALEDEMTWWNTAAVDKDHAQLAPRKRGRHGLQRRKVMITRNLMEQWTCSSSLLMERSAEPQMVDWQGFATPSSWTSPAHQAFVLLIRILRPAVLGEVECSSCLSDAEVSSDHVLRGEAWSIETKNQAKNTLEHKKPSKRARNQASA